MLAIYRLGSWLPSPGVNSKALSSLLSNPSGIIGLLGLFSGGGLTRLSVFALGIMPYITASIILQVMTPVFPNLQALQKEGELGQRKITQYTRYLTVGLAAAQALGYAYLFSHRVLGDRRHPADRRPGRLLAAQHHPGRDDADRRRHAADVDRRADHPARHRQRHEPADLRLHPDQRTRRHQRVVERLVVREAVAADRGVRRVMYMVVYVQEGIRKIPIQYAKRMVGRRMTTGGSTYLPLRVNMAGVIPVIFAAAVMAIPPTIGQLVPTAFTHSSHAP